TRRQSILEGVGLEGLIWDMIDDIIAENCQIYLDKNYPYHCIAEWARGTLGIDIDIDRIKGQELEDLENTLRSHAKNNAEQDITITLGEYMSEDVDSNDWDLKGLSKWAMSKFSVNISQNQLRKMTFEDVQDQLVEASADRIDKFDLSKMRSFLVDGFAQNGLGEWVNQKFDLKIKTEELNRSDPEAMQEFLLDRARQSYRQRELEYPVDFILNVSLRR
ncbi:MAG: hypothetical protein GY869_13830, partial [Planctomycetes bacterium]|nr:hypothetical protein [Planctomycetota bacterium]